MTRNPILRVLSTFSTHRVRSLLIGGQACIIYGASEFSRDSDFVVLSSAENLRSLRAGLTQLRARRIYVPPLETRYLDRGHACHFRCHAPGVEGLRVDVLGKLRGCDDFSSLWGRRFRLRVASGPHINVISLGDLVASKKTQRDKDWFALGRLVDSDIATGAGSPRPERVRWWLDECRNPDYLIELCRRHPGLARERLTNRPLLKAAMSPEEKKLAELLEEERLREMEKDRTYWDPLRRELELLRRKRTRRRGR